jgi:glycosyltransferase involved in cell wall biosynthesis
MNIGIVTTWFDRGAAYVSKAYMDVLSKEHQVFIYARGGEQYAIGDPRWDLDNVTWGNPVAGKPYLYIDWKEFLSWLQANHIDILLFNEQQDWDIILRLNKLNIPVGAYIDYYTVETVQFYWLYDFLLCNTQRHYGVFKNHPQSFYIPWGTDINVFKPGNEHILGDVVTFFHSCGVSPDRKGTDLLVKAFREVSGNAKLIIHSQWPLKDQFAELLRLIDDDKRIVLIEKVVAPPGLYHMGDVYVYPTILDGIGLTIAEALACGLPVITTNEPPMNEFIVDGENGKLVNVAHYERRNDNYYWKQSFCDLESLKNALEFYIENIGHLKSYKEKTRLYALEHLDWFKNADGINLIIKNIKVIHGDGNKDLLQKVKIYEEARIRNFAAPAGSYIERVKNMIRRSIVYPLAISIWQLFVKRK